jgi:hypothetical protein
MRSDYQLTTAFAYLHGYAKFNRSEDKSDRAGQ